MNISFLGDNCFRIRGNSQSIVCDPYAELNGVKMPKTQADLITMSSGKINDEILNRLDGDPFQIIGPGEYEVGGTIVLGIDLKPKSGPDSDKPLNAFLIEMSNWRISYLGSLNHPLKEKEIELMAGTDILILPIEESDKYHSKEQMTIIEQVEPKIVIPIYQAKTTLEKFIKEWGRSAIYLDKLNLKQFDLKEENQLVVLEAKN